MTKPPEVEKENSERWVLSYADLVTLLFGFFIILYATAEVDVVKFNKLAAGIAQAFNVEVKTGSGSGSAVLDGGSGIIPAPQGGALIDLDLDFVERSIRQRAAELGVDASEIVISRGETQIVVRFAGNLVFPSASAVLREDVLPLLLVVGSVIAELPNEVRVEGHTDSIPVGTSLYETNWELSSARATSVLRFLVEEAGLPAERVFAAGYGEFRPEATNATPEGRALNRRADIVILYDRDETLTALESPFFDLELPE